MYSEGAGLTGNLLSDALISVDPDGRVSLPGLMAAMARGEVRDFPALRPHQRAAWHMFLVQLAALALDRAGTQDVPDTEEGWAAALRGLTPEHGDDAPWCLWVGDRTKPAFLQPPDPGGLTWTQVPTPDALDMLITSRNHDLKTAVAVEAAPEDWIYALVSLQTQQIFNVKYHGITRAKSAVASRALIALAPARTGSAGTYPDISEWWRADVISILHHRRRLDFTHLPKAPPGLIWVLPWPQGHQFSVLEVDPLFIEASTRVRLQNHDGRLLAERCPSTPIRVLRENLSLLMEPWSPRDLDGQPFNIGSRDFTYNVIHDALLGRSSTLPEMLTERSRQTCGEWVLVCSAISVPDKSKTDGMKTRVVPVPKKVAPKLWTQQARDFSSELRDNIAKVECALVDAIAHYHARGPVVKRVAGKIKWFKDDGSEIDQDAIKKHRRAAAPARAAFDRRADALFFPALWERLDAADKTAAASRFQRQLVQMALEEFRASLPGIPCAALWRPRAEARAERAFRGTLRREYIDTGREAGDDAA